MTGKGVTGKRGDREGVTGKGGDREGGHREGR